MSSSLLAAAGITQCMKFYAIQEHQISNEVGADKDLIVGPNADVTLTIRNGQTLQVRDVVVLGKLRIKSENLENTSVKGSLIARDLFTPGTFATNNIHAKARSWAIFSNAKEFNKELQDLILDWILFQRDSAKNIGRKSVLT